LLLLLLLVGCTKPAAMVVPQDAAPVVEAGTGCVPWNYEEGCLPKTTAHATPKDAGIPEISRYGSVFDLVGGRIVNIKAAAAKLDGYTILPNETFSFNQVVGIRTAKNGYVDAPVLLQGRRTQDLGGGVCQVSSTLHAAAINSGLTIVERRPHSLVPKYIDPGFDATVAFPASCEVPNGPCEKLDLKIRNPFDMPIMIHTAVTEGESEGVIKGHLNVVIHGLAPQYKVDVRRQTEQMGRGGRRWVRSGRNLSASYVAVVQQKGEGYFVRCTATYYDLDTAAVVREFKWFSRYPPVDEVWEVGYLRPEDAGAPWGGP